MDVEDKVRHMVSDAMWSGLTSFPILAQESGISEKRLRDMIDGTAPIFVNDVSDIFHALGMRFTVETKKRSPGPAATVFAEGYIAGR